MFTVRPDLAAYLLNYQDNDVINSEANSSFLCEESSSNDINEENTTSDSERLPKRQRKENRTPNRKSNEKAKLTLSTTNKSIKNIRVNTRTKNKKVCQTMTGPNNLFSKKSIIELLKYQESHQMDTTYSAHRNEEVNLSRYSEMERHGFDSGIHLNDKWNRTCLIPVNSNEMSDSDSDDDSDNESFTEDQLALIETVMSHDIAACEFTDLSPQNGKQNNTFLPPNKDIFDNAKQTSQSESNDSSSSQELIPHEPCSTIEDQEVYVDCSRDNQEIEHAASQPERDQETINIDTNYTQVDITETSSDSEDSILSAELDNSVQTQDITSPFTHLENAENTILPEVTHPSNKIMQNDNNNSTEEIEPVPSVKKDVIMLDSDCEVRSIQSLDSDLFARNDVIASTPIHSASANTSIDNNSLEPTPRFVVHQCPPNERSKHAIDYLMKMDEDDVDDAIESMLTSQFPRFDAFSTLLHPTRLPLCSSHYEDSEQQSSSIELVDDMIIETEVCAEVTVDNDIPNPLEEDAPFLPPERRDTAAVTQEELPSNLQTPSTDTPQVAQKNSKNKCKPKIAKIKENKPVKPKTDRSVIQKKLKQKKCTVMTELKKQQLLSKYITGKQMQLVIPFLPIRSKKKTNFKVMPRNMSVITKVINKRASVTQKIPCSGKDTAEINPNKDTRISSPSTTSNTWTSEDVDKKELEVPTDDDNDTIRSTSTSVANDSNSSYREPNVNNVKVNNHQRNQNTECSSINNNTPCDSEMCDKSLSTTNNVGLLSAACGQDIDTDESNTIRQQAHQISSRQASTGSTDLGFNVELSDTKEDEEALKLHSDDNCEENVVLSSCVVQAKEQSEDEDYTPIANSCQHTFVFSCKDTLIQEEELQEGSLELSLGKNTKNDMDNDTSSESCKDTLFKKKGLQEESTELSLEKITDADTMDTDSSAESYKDIPLQEVMKDDNDQCQHALIGSCQDVVVQEIELQEESTELFLEKVTDAATLSTDTSAESCQDILLQEVTKDDNDQCQHALIGSCQDVVVQEIELQEETTELFLEKVTDAATLSTDTSAESCKDILLQEVTKDDNDQCQHALIGSCQDVVVQEIELQEETTELFLEKVTDAATLSTDTSAESFKDCPLQEVTKDGNDQCQYALVGNCQGERELPEESIELSLEKTTNVTTINSDNPIESYQDIPLQETSKGDKETGESTMDLNSDSSIPVNHCEDIIGEDKVIEEKCVQNPMENRNISGYNIVSSNKDMASNGDHNERILSSENKLQEEKPMQFPSKADNPGHGTKVLKSDVSELVTVDQCDSTPIQEKECLTNDDQFGEDTVPAVDSSQNTLLHWKEKLEKESKKSNNPESVSSCALMFSCKDISHQSESLEISSKEETSLQSITTHNLNSTYLDISCHEENTNERNVTIRKRKAESMKDSFITAANKSEDVVEAKKPKRRMKEKAIKYYKKKIKQLKRENEQYKDKSLMLDWVSDFRNEIKHLKKSIETLQKKNEEHASIINRQEADLHRLGQEMSLLNPSTRNSRRQQFPDRQDATITSSDSNECKP